MHIRLVFRITALLLLIICFFMTMPIITALYYQEFSLLPSFVIPLGATFIFCLFVLLLTGKSERLMSSRDGFLLVSLSWLFSSLVGALPFFLSGFIPNFADAFFETMSGFTTTGASILTEIESLPKALLFWRSLTHWLGGMGIVVLTMAVLPLLGIGGVQLMKAESPGPTLDKLTPKITETAKILWGIYLGLTVAQTLLLMFGQMDLFDALTHTFGTLATGGFSPKNSSVGHYNSAYIDIVITVFMVLAGMNFVLFYRLLTGNIKPVLKNTELKVYLGIFLTASLGIALVLNGTTYNSFGTSMRYAAFQAASILTTTGYATADFALWPEFARTILFFLMFIGGCAGSTGGGIKVTRIITLFKQGFHEMTYLAHPRVVFRFKLEGQAVTKDRLYSISGFFFLYIMILLITSLVVSSGGYDILTSFTCALATVGNIGPGFGKIGPAMNYAFFPDYIKWFLSFAMMVGRLEIYTVLILFSRKFVSR